MDLLNAAAATAVLVEKGEKIVVLVLPTRHFIEHLEAIILYDLIPENKKAQNQDVLVVGLSSYISIQIFSSKCIKFIFKGSYQLISNLKRMFVKYFFLNFLLCINSRISSI